MKSHINCANIWFVYVINGFSDNPHPSKSILYTVCDSANTSFILNHSSDDDATSGECTSRIGVPCPFFLYFILPNLHSNSFVSSFPRRFFDIACILVILFISDTPISVEDDITIAVKIFKYFFTVKTSYFIGSTSLYTRKILKYLFTFIFYHTNIC